MDAAAPAIDGARQPRPADVGSAVGGAVVLVRSLPFEDRHVAGFELMGWPENPRAGVYRFENDIEVDRTAASWLPAVLPILMRVGEDATFAEPLDSVGVAHAGRAQDILIGWHPDLRRVHIAASRAGSPGAAAAGVGCFFSGGVDSFYSVIERLEEITHLVFVLGFDISLDDGELVGAALAGVRAAARELGKPLIVVYADIRALSDRWVAWGEIYHGAALATTGLLLANHVGRMIIPSSYHKDELFPWGTHPALDALWSTSRVTMEHHGVERHRTEKIGVIASNPVALRHLRVCWENRGGAYNCGQCEKCLRTMVTLRAFGALELCETFPRRIDPSLLRAMRRPTRGVSTYARENLALLASQGTEDPELVRELWGIVRRERSWRVARKLRAMLPRRHR
jgi:hypothetical protein